MVGSAAAPSDALSIVWYAKAQRKNVRLALVVVIHSSALHTSSPRLRRRPFAAAACALRSKNTGRGIPIDGGNGHRRSKASVRFPVSCRCCQYARKRNELSSHASRESKSRTTLSFLPSKAMSTRFAVTHTSSIARAPMRLLVRRVSKSHVTAPPLA